MEKSACFTGHRDLSESERSLSERLYSLLEKLVIEDGITDFYAGGAVGFDTVAAKCVLRLKEKFPQVKLHLVLPCSNEQQTKKWTANQKYEFRQILTRADSVEYTSQHQFRGCMAVRNARLVEHAEDYCICYHDPARKNGTSQTIGFAEKKGLKVINLYKGVQ
ncbi:MAG: DUF1273 family protein [Ruminococcus sp.]|nr:DUF1273 family protein [Ruminococcus sp.]